MKKLIAIALFSAFSIIAADAPTPQVDELIGTKIELAEQRNANLQLQAQTLQKQLTDAFTANNAEIERLVGEAYKKAKLDPSEYTFDKTKLQFVKVEKKSAKK